MEVIIDDKKYEVIKDYNNALDINDLHEKITDYYEEFDYRINDYRKIDEYMKEYCAYGCKYFILKRIDKES